MKIISLLLTLVLLVCAFAACGGADESELPEDSQNVTETSAPQPEETKAPVDPATCEHSYMPINSTASCTEGGVNEEKCFACGTTRTVEVDALGHTYNVGSLDKQYGRYTKKTCLVCGEVLYEGLPEMMMNLTFEYSDKSGIEKEVTNMTVNNSQTGGTYAGGKVSLSNKKIWIKDDQNKLAANNFVFKMKVKFDQFCPEETYQLSAFSILTGTVDKVSGYNALVKIDKDGYVYLSISGKYTKINARLELGREYELGVLANNAEGTYDFYLDGEVAGQGTLATAITSPAEDTVINVRLFDSRDFKVTVDDVVLAIFDSYELPDVSTLEFE